MDQRLLGRCSSVARTLREGAGGTSRPVPEGTSVHVLMPDISLAPLSEAASWQFNYSTLPWAALSSEGAAGGRAPECWPPAAFLYRFPGALFRAGGWRESWEWSSFGQPSANFGLLTRNVIGLRKVCLDFARPKLNGDAGKRGSGQPSQKRTASERRKPRHEYGRGIPGKNQPCAPLNLKHPHQLRFQLSGCSSNSPVPHNAHQRGGPGVSIFGVACSPSWVQHGPCSQCWVG